MTLRALYQQTKQIFSQAGLESPAFDALCLLERVFGVDRQTLILHGEQCVPLEKEGAFTALVQRRARREPLQYLLGEWPFLSLTLAVGEGVLIPREDTELLVRTAAKSLPARQPMEVLDLCAGTGAVGLGLRSLCPEARVTCVERFDAAWVYLQKNVRKYAADFPVETLQADVLDPRTAERFAGVDAILSNPPYITTGDLPGLQEEVQWEPATALDGGADGLLFYRALAEHWIPRLNPRGFVAVEVGEGQAQDVCALFRNAGLAHADVFSDFSGIARVVFSRR